MLKTELEPEELEALVAVGVFLVVPPVVCTSLGDVVVVPVEAAAPPPRPVVIGGPPI